MADHPDRHASMEDIKRSLGDLHGKMDALIAEIGPGIPPADQRGERATIRSRLHKVEHDRDVIETLAANLNTNLSEVAGVVRELKEERDTTRAVQQELARRLTKWKARSLYFFAAVGALGTLVSIVILIVDRGAS